MLRGLRRTLRCLDKVSHPLLRTTKNPPWKTKLTVKKYVPMGSVIMAKVKLINFQMTDLSWCKPVHRRTQHQRHSRWHRRRDIGRLWRALAIVVKRRLVFGNKSSGRHVWCGNAVQWERHMRMSFPSQAESSNVMGTMARLEVQAPRFPPTRFEKKARLRNVLSFRSITPR